MSGRNTAFEVHILKNKNWVIQDVRPDEAQAWSYAESLLQKGNLQAVRVVRTYMRQDGLQTETVLMEKTGELHPKTDIALSPVQEAPQCSKADDLFALPARLTLGRLVRKYLDAVVLTPTEFLHSPSEMRRFADKDRLLMSAVDIIAGLQSRQSGDDPKSRRDTLFAYWEQLFSRGRGAAVKGTPGRTFADFQTAANGSGDDREYRLLMHMTARLVEVRNWLGKLDLLLNWSAEPQAARDMALIDGVVADLMVPSQMIQDLLGFQENLGSALCQLADLAQGRAEPAKFAPACFGALNSLFAAGRLPQARQVLLERVLRELRGVNVLSRNEPGKEYEVFSRVLHHLVGAGGVTGGPAMAEALVNRYGGLLKLNGPGSTLKAIEGLLGVLADCCRRMHLLLALGGAGMPPQLLDLLEAQVEGGDRINYWVPVKVPPRDRMMTVTNAHGTLSQSKVVPNPPRDGLARLLDDVLARYLVEEGVIEKIDKADDPLAMRAIRLVKFCSSGVLIKGRSLNLARERVISHLRQPHFEEKFRASCGNPAQADQMFRDFHRMLKDAGFA